MTHWALHSMHKFTRDLLYNSQRRPVFVFFLSFFLRLSVGLRMHEQCWAHNASTCKKNKKQKTNRECWDIETVLLVIFSGNLSLLVLVGVWLIVIRYRDRDWMRSQQKKQNDYNNIKCKDDQTNNFAWQSDTFAFDIGFGFQISLLSPSNAFHHQL